ncbi:SGNH/GDSL hydrolase family protein [Actinocorallia populi]|uniref:SGNH/GDSL hydrolase family protein n=1 Tax=Actinocorallia populi TaxID=2079200 RepID=UPI000D08D2BB|nr:SGNH/GDSL hydrolase family protein [Actinocorallia populi]
MRTWARGGARGLLALALLAVVLVGLGVPLLSEQARCRMFGIGCAGPSGPPPLPAAAVPGRRPLTPLEVASQGAYVALGDSFSSGEGAYALPDDLSPENRCHRTSRSYVHAVSRTFEFAGGTRFFACAGARTEHFFSARAGEPPQVEHADAGTSLITLSIGGNDLGFTKVLAGCILSLPWSGACQEQDAGLETRKPVLRGELTRIVGSLRERSPRARIILLGYPRLFGEREGSALDNLGVADQRWLNAKGKELNDLVHEVARTADRELAQGGAPGSVEFIDVYSAFTGHEVGTGAPYVNGLDVDLSAFKAEFHSYHPNAAGYTALAELVTRQVRQGPGRQINQWH